MLFGKESSRRRSEKGRKYFPIARAKERNTPFLYLSASQHPMRSGAQIHTFQVFPFASCIISLGSVLRYAANVFAKPDPISTIERARYVNLRAPQVRRTYYFRD
jgi:hypothetical protein